MRKCIERAWRAESIAHQCRWQMDCGQVLLHVGEFHACSSSVNCRATGTACLHSPAMCSSAWQQSPMPDTCPQVGYTCIWMAQCSELSFYRKLYGPSVLLKMNLVSGNASTASWASACPLSGDMRTHGDAAQIPTDSRLPASCRCTICPAYHC